MPGDGLSGALQTLPVVGGPSSVVSAFLALVRPVVEQSAAGSGCAVAAACTESPAGSPLHDASAEVFGAWRSRLADRLVAAGATEVEATATSALLLATLEGAHVTCRAADSIEPFDAACAALRAAGLA